MQLKSTESEIQASIIEYLRIKKYTVWRLNSGNFFLPCGNGKFRKIEGLPKGTPDLQVMYYDPDLCLGITDFIEVKSETGKVSKDQKIMHKNLKDLGFYVYIFHSIDECIKIYN